MWTPCGTPPWHVQMSIGSVWHQLWASNRELLHCAASAMPNEHDTNPLNSDEQGRRPWACFTARRQLWNVSFELFYVRCVRRWYVIDSPTHTFPSTPRSVRLRRRWEHHPRGSVEQTQGEGGGGGRGLVVGLGKAPGIIQTHRAVGNASCNHTHVNYNKPCSVWNSHWTHGTNLATPGGKAQDW